MGHADAPVLGDPQPLTIRAALGHRFANAKQFFLLNAWSIFTIYEYRGNPAHGSHFSQIKLE
jgi:hypothetical protein